MENLTWDAWPAFLFAIIVLTTAYYFSLKWRRRRFLELAAAFPGPPSVPIFGNLHLFLGNREDVIDEVMKYCGEYGGKAVRWWFGNMLFIIVFNPEDLRIVLNSPKSLEKAHLYSFFKDVVGLGLFTAPVEKWKKHRRLLNPAFNYNMLERFVPVLNEVNAKLTGTLKSRVETDEEFDAWLYLEPAVLKMICKTTVGCYLDESSEGIEFSKYIARAQRIIATRICNIWYYPEVLFNIYALAAGFYDICKTVRKFPSKLIADINVKNQQNKENAGNEDNDNSLLQFLMNCNKNGRAGFTEEDVTDEIITAMVAGSETTALTNCFALLMLAMNPEIQEKVYEEIFQVFGESDRPFTKEDAYKLRYLEQCVEETLRLFPAAPCILRNATEDIEITNNLIIPRGGTIVVPAIRTHRDPNIYPNPLEFNPENFSPNAVRGRHPYSFIGFSKGPRGCIGGKYAMLAMKGTLSTILRNYVLTTNAAMKDVELIKTTILIRSVRGFPIKIRDRKQVVLDFP